MKQGLEGLLESGILNEETKVALEEAWKDKLEEVRSSLREEVEVQVREEMTARYENDKSNLVEAMDRMMTDAVNKFAAETANATKSLNEERERLTKSVKEARLAYKNKMESHIKVLENFVLTQLKSEIEELAQDHKAIQEQRVKLAQEIANAKSVYEAKLVEHTNVLKNFVLSKLSEEVKQVAAQKKALSEMEDKAREMLRNQYKSLNEQAAERVNKLEKFVVEQLRKELSEFEEDKKALAETRVRLISESKAKLEETKKAFIARASKLVESAVKKQLHSELTQLREDIQSARENMFGRRLFEAFQAEFLTSYLNENSEIKKLSKKLDETMEALKLTESKLSKKDEEIARVARRAKLAEDRANRVKTMNELLAPLSKEKRVVMEELLETVKTESLREAYHKYLPTILSENKATAQGRRMLSETAPEKRNNMVAVTGNRKSVLAESARASEDAQSDKDEIVRLRRLAGIEK